MVLPPTYLDYAAAVEYGGGGGGGGSSYGGATDANANASDGIIGIGGGLVTTIPTTTSTLPTTTTAAAAAAATSATATKMVNEEWHEFVIIYEGPPCHRRHDDNHDDYDYDSNSSSRGGRRRRNRQTFCLMLPPSSTTTTNSTSNCSSSKSNGKGDNTTTWISPYISEQDLLLAASTRIGWPAQLLCCRLLKEHGTTTTTTPPPHSIHHPYTTQTVNHHHHHHHYPTTATNNTTTTTALNNTPIILIITLHPKITAIRGGKGGFGTLLRGQSRQAGAKRTVDFGACRDLSGRRLRHVNDELKLRKWKELEEAKKRSSSSSRIHGATAAGGGSDAATAATSHHHLAEMELSSLRTPSGIRNWHLSIPSWSDMASTSNKGRRKTEKQLEREVRGYQTKEERVRMEQERKRMDRENSVLEYVRRGEKEGERISSSLSSSSSMGGGAVASVKEEILAHYLKKRKMDGLVRGSTSSVGKLKSGDDGKEEEESASISERLFSVDEQQRGGSMSSYLMTLSGDLSVLEPPPLTTTMTTTTTTGETMSLRLPPPPPPTLQRIQSQSDFATAVVLLDAVKLRDISSGGGLVCDDGTKKEKRGRGVYIEYTIQTAGLAQIGWIRGPSSSSSNGSTVAFLPNSDTGDGVGDDAASYGYDGSRGLLFHGGGEEEETAYGPSLEDSSSGIVGGWKSGDVLGSYMKYSSSSETGTSENNLAMDSERSTTIEIGYTLNGLHLGVAFTVPLVAEDDIPNFYPALSLNLDEVVDVNIGPEFAYNNCMMDGCVGAYEVMSDEAVDRAPGDDTDTELGGGNDGLMMAKTGNGKASSLKRPRADPLVQPSIVEETAMAPTTEQGEMNNPSKAAETDPPYDLNTCNSIDELKALGPERLKNIMLSMGVKCG